MTAGAIHQFHAGSAVGDGITNGMFFIRRMLREAGYVSEIYCIHVDPALVGDILPKDALRDDLSDLLLVHYSLGSDEDWWITGLRMRRVLVYHNITPAHFFPTDSPFHRLSGLGREQLGRWAGDGTFVGAIADSDYNAEELSGLGFAAVDPVGLLVDLDRIRGHAFVAEAGGAGGAGLRTLLFVGRLCAHKNQLDLVRMMGVLVASRPNVRLLLAGAAAVPEYAPAVVAEVERLGLGAHVSILGHCSDAEIYGLYREADLYVSASRHEGFGMPLVEAMAFDLPVVAIAAGGVAGTLGTGGLVLEEGSSPGMLAAVVRVVLEEPGLRRQMIDGQRASVARFERGVLAGAFEASLRGMGLDVTLDGGGGGGGGGLPAPARRWVVQGPFDSSYSLAVVNRELAQGLARVLARRGETVALVSRDGPGRFAPDPGFLAGHADISAMVRRGTEGGLVAVCLRNQYPPHVADMRGEVRVLANYAWEESGFPAGWVEELNACLDLVTVTSGFVAKVLRDNGVRTPIAVVGNGVDQAGVDGAEADGAGGPETGVFRFLHISSGFPRKGIDVLLAAWRLAFRAGDPVELVVKTFPNPHNQVAGELCALRASDPEAAPVMLIDADLGRDALSALYRSARVVVGPSRGEGFGLPLAEAMAWGKPVITTGHGGQTDFCTAETAWLCDYTFEHARTHLAVPDSVWAEPDAASLARLMRRVFDAPVEVLSRVEAGRALVARQHSWDMVARRTQAAIERVRAQPAADRWRRPTIGLVSTWNTRCGIAAYAQSLLGGIGASRLHVFANREADVPELDQEFVRRCWMQDRRDTLDDLFDAVCAAGVDVVLVQFNFGFFGLAPLGRLLERLWARGVAVFVTLHSTQDVVRPDLVIRLSEIAGPLSRASRLLVHSVHDLNRLKALGLVGNVTLFPMGMPEPFAGDRAALRRSLGWEGKAVVASFGYLLPGKGLRELISAVGLLRARVPNVHLLLLNALYPVPESQIEAQACREEIELAGIGRCVSFVTDFLDEAAVVARLTAADVVTYAYQRSQESASAAVKMGLASLRPVAVTPLPIFADVAELVHRLPGVEPDAIAEGLAAVLGGGGEGVGAKMARQRAWVAAHAWPALLARLDGLVTGVWREQAMGFVGK